jgi:hypothetical protein
LITLSKIQNLKSRIQNSLLAWFRSNARDLPGGTIVAVSWASSEMMLHNAGGDGDSHYRRALPDDRRSRRRAWAMC